jgi:uncharacterized damage-inducible protein DinB
MNEILMYAKHNQAANRIVYDLLDKMSNDDREKDRGSYYGSLSGLFRHIIGGACYYLKIFKKPLGNNSDVEQKISAVENLPKIPAGPLSEAQWKELGPVMSVVDAACISMAEAMKGNDLNLLVNVDWYEGKPASVPLFFMLSQLLVHNVHHRGQISQILDSLKIENDFSRIDVSFLRQVMHAVPIVLRRLYLEFSAAFKVYCGGTAIRV